MTSEQQPSPVPNASPPLWELVIEDMKKRDHVGRDRYKTPLQANNGRDALQDLYEELLDAAVYTKQVMVEREAKATLPPCETKLNDLLHDLRCHAAIWPAESIYSRAIEAIEGMYGTAELLDKTQGESVKRAMEILGAGNFDNVDHAAQKAMDRIRKLEAQSCRCAGVQGAHERIIDPCPSCGLRSLFVGKGGYVTCSNLYCDDPGVGRAIEAMKAKLKAAEVKGDTDQLTTVLHSKRAHPDYTYIVVPAGPGVWIDVVHSGWEPCPEWKGAPGDECWRRRKA